MRIGQMAPVLVGVPEWGWNTGLDPDYVLLSWYTPTGLRHLSFDNKL